MPSSSSAGRWPAWIADGGAMGLFDTVVVLDDLLHCPHGHRVSDFQTMDVYLFDGPRVYRVARGRYAEDDDAILDTYGFSLFPD
jgi:hypothetical protein